MITTPWAHLPNAKHIDAVLADVKARPEVWAAALLATKTPALDAAWDAARSAARSAAWDAGRSAAWDAGRSAAWDAARDAAWDVAWDVAWAAAWDAVWDVIRALVAWDSSATLLECTPDVLRTMIDLAEPPVCHQAALLLPYAIVRFGE